MIDNATIHQLSEELVALQKPIRILDGVAWDDQVRADFLANNGERQPDVGPDYYQQRPPAAVRSQRTTPGVCPNLQRRVQNRVGGSPVAELLLGRIAEYLRVIDMLQARGTPGFAPIAAELYGAPDGEMHEGGPTLASLGQLMDDALDNIDSGSWEPPEERNHTAPASVEILSDRLAGVFGEKEIRIKLDDGIIADAAAGGDYIKLREDAMFSDRDLRVLEVHEGWVHVATTLNGRKQPVCTFLAKGTPSTTSTQEGLAVFTEITTMSSTPERLRRVTRRVLAIGMAADGATFLDVYRWFLDEGLDEPDAWVSSVRVFRGSTPTDGPFTKDLVYSLGFLEVYNFIRLAVQRGRIERLPLLFCGKLALHELGALASLSEQGLIAAPEIMPPHIKEVSALASWMAYSNLLNRVDVEQMEISLGSAFD